MTQKKAQGLPLNVIIIAAIALIVLVVLIMIFTGRMGIFTGQVDSCSAMGGFCYNSGQTPDKCGTNLVDVNGDGKLEENVDFRVTDLGASETIKGCTQGQICCHALTK